MCPLAEFFAVMIEGRDHSPVHPLISELRAERYARIDAASLLYRKVRWAIGRTR